MTINAETSDRLKQLRHDILNSLNVIRLGAKALEQSQGDPELLAYVCGNIEREQQRATDLLGELVEAAGVAKLSQSDDRQNN